VAANKISQPQRIRSIVSDTGKMTQEFDEWVQVITQRSLIIGTGSPEAVIVAGIGSEYMDDAGTAGSIKYIKRDADDGLGDRSKGWILI